MWCVKVVKGEEVISNHYFQTEALALRHATAKRLEHRAYGVEDREVLIIPPDLQPRLEADRVESEAQDLINRLKDILDDLERAAEHGAEGILVLFQGQFLIDHVNSNQIEVTCRRLQRSLGYYNAAKHAEK